MKDNIFLFDQWMVNPPALDRIYQYGWLIISRFLQAKGIVDQYCSFIHLRKIVESTYHYYPFILEKNL